MARKHKDSRHRAGRHPAPSSHEPASAPRIVGGSLGGRRLVYAVQQDRTRPMKDRVREAVFNLLGPDVTGKHAVDLFAGTGALAFEAISRGAERATLIEQHFPTASVIRQNAAELGVAERVEVLPASAFAWAQQPTLGDKPPWLVFCSPPFRFYVERREAMLSLIGGLIERAPSESVFVVESDRNFDPRQLVDPERWHVRDYPPAIVAIYKK